MVAAEAGLRVVVLEAGGWFTPEDMTQREEQMLPQLYWDAAGRTTADRRIRLHQGKGVGGSTLHNLNLCKRIDHHVLSQWRGLGHLPASKWDALFAEVETMLGVTVVPRSDWNLHNRLLQAACEKLGWRWSGLAHNREGCVGSGFCELGCAFDAKNNAAKVLLPRAIDRGAIVIHHAAALRIETDANRAVAVHACATDEAGDKGEPWLTVQADHIVVAASATGTPALLLRSQILDPYAVTGKSLHIHPAVVAAGVFDDPVNAWLGIPQTVECTEFLRLSADSSSPSRIWIVPAFGHPMGTATLMPSFAARHREFMLNYPRLAVFCAMLHDETCGTVTPAGDTGVSVDYRLTEPDKQQLRAGLHRLGEALFAAGARQVWIPTPEPLVLTSPSELKNLATVDVELLGPTAVHPMASCPMNDDPRLGPVDSTGKHHHVEGLWIADGSLYPTSIGGPPQLGIYALGLHVGRHLVAAAR